MAGLTTEELRFAVWFVAAGFVAGFALSTLWEWLYGRSRRFTVESLVSSVDIASPITRPAPPPIVIPQSGAVLEIERSVRPLQALEDGTMLGAFEPFEAPARAPYRGNGIAPLAGV